MQDFLKRIFGRKESSRESVESSSIHEKQADIPIPVNDPLPPVVKNEKSIETEISDFGITATAQRDMHPYEPTLDLPNYHNPTLYLLHEVLKPIFAPLSEISTSLPIIWSVN